MPCNFVTDSFYTKKLCSRLSSSEYRFKIGDFAPTGPVDPKFQVEGVPPDNHSSSQKTRLNDLVYGIKIWTDLYSVLSQCTRYTDRQTVGRTDISCSAVKTILLSHIELIVCL